MVHASPDLVLMRMNNVFLVGIALKVMEDWTTMKLANVTRIVRY
jgi:hypothetical protein